MTYASTAWSWFVTASDIQRVDAFLRRSKRCGFCPPNLPDFSEQLAESTLYTVRITRPDKNKRLDKFFDDWLRGVDSVEGQKPPFQIDKTSCR